MNDLNRAIVRIQFICFVSLFAISIVACSRANPVLPTAAPSLDPTVTTEVVEQITPTAFQPSPTPAALAATVNGTGIDLMEYQAQQAQYAAVLGRALAPEEEQSVLDDMINEILLSQAALESGFQVDEATVQARIASLAEQVGGEQALNGWMSAHGYTQDTFRMAMARAIQAAWMRDTIGSSVTESAEQVRTRQILLFDALSAQDVFSRLQNGADFEQLAVQYDPVAEGEMGWFPRGYLPYSQIEEAAFNLQPGEYSTVIETPSGFHILQVMAREALRPLDPDALLTLQTAAVQRWLAEQRSQSNIQVLQP